MENKERASKSPDHHQDDSSILHSGLVHLQAIGKRLWDDLLTLTRGDVNLLALFLLIVAVVLVASQIFTIIGILVVASAAVRSSRQSASSRCNLSRSDAHAHKSHASSNPDEASSHDNDHPIS